MPVKQAALAKERLTSALGNNRELFARALSLNTIEVIRRSNLFDGIIVITSDPLVREASSCMHILVLNDSGFGLNDACSRGIAAAAAIGADICTIVHSDLATLNAATLEHILQQFLTVRSVHGPDSIGLVRCKSGTGTNVVLLNPTTPFTPAFGRDSFAAHLRVAGRRAYELEGGEAAFDIDTSDDLNRLVAKRHKCQMVEKLLDIAGHRTTS